MGRYIDADSLIRTLYVQSDDDGFICCGADDLENLINAQPTAELPIKEKCCVCPHCDNCDVNEDGIIVWKKGEWIEHTNYCPNCGARIEE